MPVHVDLHGSRRMDEAKKFPSHRSRNIVSRGRGKQGKTEKAVIEEDSRKRKMRRLPRSWWMIWGAAVEHSRFSFWWTIWKYGWWTCHRTTRLVTLSEGAQDVANRIVDELKICGVRDGQQAVRRRKKQQEEPSRAEKKEAASPRWSEEKYDGG